MIESNPIPRNSYSLVENQKKLNNNLTLASEKTFVSNKLTFDAVIIDNNNDSSINN